MTGLQITLSLEASTREELSAMTINAQLNWGMVLTFFDFTQTKSGSFICWYTVPHLIYTEKVLNGQA